MSRACGPAQRNGPGDLLAPAPPWDMTPKVATLGNSKPYPWLETLLLTCGEFGGVVWRH